MTRSANFLMAGFMLVGAAAAAAAGRPLWTVAVLIAGAGVRGVRGLAANPSIEPAVVAGPAQPIQNRGGATVRGGPGAVRQWLDEPDAGGDGKPFDPDAALARHLARKSAAGDAESAHGPIARPTPPLPARTYGRKQA